MKASELAWQAGFVDGEGCITIARQIYKNRPSPKFRVCITIANTDRSLLVPFLESWGGSIYHSLEKRNNWADAFTWHCPNGQAGTFIKAMMPHLRGKYRQAEVLLRFIACMKSFKRHSLGQGNGTGPLTPKELQCRIGLWNEIRLLNTKGQYSRKSSRREVPPCNQKST